ncbi:hypothetical protein GCM10023322_76680 [Rugosimonospora acidiphila]|uniref:Crotonobetainyl-CoA:carnitine CoA-transferase CaiB n=1 Tax=Rugosimonospora acidiphila TaxID=556531 RepID=A0ABP9SSK0_9ACTN
MDRLTLSDPLADVRVLQIGRRLAGRTLTRLLTDQGARARVVDLDAPDVRATALAAGAGCRVVIDAAAPGRAAAAGLGFDDLRAVRPDLIHCALPVYPPGTAPEPAGVDDDVAVAAELGLNDGAGGRPRDEQLPVGSSFGAFMAAGYIVAALLGGGDEPAGQRIVVPLAAAALTTVARRLIRAEDAGLVDPIAGPRLPIAGRYECADGRFIQSGGAYRRFVETLIDVIDRPQWRQPAVEALYGLPSPAAEAMWRERLEAVFRERSAEEWERDINAAGGSCTQCRTRAEWLAEPHARAAAIVVSDGGRPRAGRAVRVFETPPGTPPPGAPRSARAAGDPAPAGAGGAPLAGLVVVDLSIVLAGPTCGRTLADLGADVIKVDDPRRPVSPYGWLEVNRGKRSILLDLRREEGREVLWRMLARADVLIENYRHGKLDRLGFGFEEVARVRPGIVYASLNAFDVGGPWASRPGWEHNAQAATGMQLALPGWGPGTPPGQVTYPLNDFGTGLLGAYGILLALRRREATGAAQFVGASLARTATVIQSPLFEGGADRGADGPHWLPCPDGFVGVLIAPATGPGVGSVNGAAGGPGAESLRRARDIAVLARDREDAAARLREAGFGCVVLRGSAELPSRPWVAEGGLAVEWEHPRWGGLRQSRPRGWASGFAPSPGYPAPDPGRDTSALLSEHGYDEREVRHLVGSGTVASRPLFEMWSDA